MSWKILFYSQEKFLGFKINHSWDFIITLFWKVLNRCFELLNFLIFQRLHWLRHFKEEKIMKNDFLDKQFSYSCKNIIQVFHTSSIEVYSFFANLPSITCKQDFHSKRTNTCSGFKTNIKNLHDLLEWWFQTLIIWASITNLFNTLDGKSNLNRQQIFIRL
jgi:hypothetical protein